MSFKPFVSNLDFNTTLLFENELSGLINNNIVAWSITNRRTAFSPANAFPNALTCILTPLYTNERILGLILIITNVQEIDYSREKIQIMTLACTQTALYADNLSMYRDLQETQSRLVNSEKLSALGQLAAGIAHEINNPVGYVLGNSEILVSYVNALKNLLVLYEKRAPEQVIENFRKEHDIAYLMEDIDGLMTANVNGLNRVIEIVADLKDFAHIDQKHIVAPADLEENIMKTLTIANNEIKYSAVVTTNFGNISPLNCNISEINQVFLNIIINAAQAIKEQNRTEKGTNIHYHTRRCRERLLRNI